ncbi:hypothetical protein DFP73DRAFT_532282 [Morchella snyderi]|nr:hypothetical protein DFP73DRAFT_532282 [Morchella snyderi]
MGKMEVVYRPEAGGRGTVRILLSCTATYIFCVWTSLHPNILPGKGSLRRSCYKVVLMIIAILVPEAIMMCAVGELWQAWRLKKKWVEEVEKLMKDEMNTAPEVQRALKKMKHKLPLQAAFFVIMGGFLVNQSKLTAWSLVDEPMDEGTCKRWWKALMQVLSKALRKVMCRNEKPSLEKYRYRKIKDKGKALRKAVKKGSDTAEERWWMHSYVHKLVLTNKTAHYSPPHLQNSPSHHECDDADITYQALGQNKLLDTMAQPVDGRTRPPPCRSPDSFASCHVTWTGHSEKQGEIESSPKGINAAGIKAVGVHDTEAGDAEIGPAEIKLTKTNSEADGMDIDPNDLEPGTYSTILTPAGLIHCLRYGQIDHNSFHKADMEDKGTSSTIAKVVACVQVLWLVAQSFGRWRNDPQLPLTLLEVHVLLQVACAGFTYLCWWVKPLGAIEPIVVTLHNRSAEDCEPPPKFIDRGEIMKLYTKSKESRREGHGPLHFLTTRKSNHLGRLVMLKALMDVITRISPQKLLRGEENKTHTPNSQDTRDTALGRMSYMIVAGLLLAVVAALHLVALDVDFSSDAEKVMWQASCFGLIGWPFAVLPILYFTDYHEDVFRNVWEFGYEKTNIFVYVAKGIHEICATRGASRAGSAPAGAWKSLVYGYWVLFHYILIIICMILISAGLWASFYLTVESYFAMRSPPAGSFQTPKASWIELLPHV